MSYRIIWSGIQISNTLRRKHSNGCGLSNDLIDVYKKLKTILKVGLTENELSNIESAKKHFCIYYLAEGMNRHYKLLDKSREEIICVLSLLKRH